MNMLFIIIFLMHSLRPRRMAEQMDPSGDAGLVTAPETGDPQKEDEPHCAQDFRQGIM